MAQGTKDQLLLTARNLFAERGFYGVSIANIADKHGLTKQALLHHFPTKEKLYGQVLKEISEELDDLMAAARSSSDDPKTQLMSLFQGFVSDTHGEAVRTRLLMRELLDNKHRAETAGAWYLKAFLKNLVKMAKTLPGWENVPDSQALALVYQLLGAVNYYAISQPTLRGVFGAKGAKALNDCYIDQLNRVMHAAFSPPPTLMK